MVRLLPGISSLFLPFRSIHLHFFQNLSRFFPVFAVANTGSCVGPQNKIGHPVGCRFLRWVPAEQHDFWDSEVCIQPGSNPLLLPRSGELRMQKLKSHLVRTQSLNVLPLKPGVSQYIAIHATLTARNFFLISTLPVHSPAFFPKPLPIVSCVGCDWHRFLCRPAEWNRSACWMRVPMLSALGI